MIHNFNYYAPTEIVFGQDTVKQTGQHVKKYGGNKVLIVYGSDRIAKSGLLDAVTRSLKENGIEYELLGGVVPNPHLSKVYEGIELGKEKGIDFLLAIGGGSVIDTAKAISYGLAAPDRDVWDFYSRKGTIEKALPIGAVLTISAAGSEMSNSSVITNEKTKEKRGSKSDLGRPKFAVLDPNLTMSLPDYQTESGAADIMMHTMERYFNDGGSMPLTDSFATDLLKNVMKNARILHHNPEDYNARAELMWAGSLSHNNLMAAGNGAGDWSTHKLEHELGGLFDVTHGAGLTALWGSWARYVLSANPARFAKFAREVMDVGPGPEWEVALEGIDAMEQFFREIGMPTSMNELGVCPTDDQMKEMAQSAIRGMGGPVGAVKKLDEDDIIAIYQAAL